MSINKTDVVVIGGGLHGLSAALHLARAGQRITILERSWVGRHASGSTAAGVRTLNRHPAEVPISLEAMDMWHNMEAIVGDNCGFQAFGQIKVAEFESHVPVLEKRISVMQAAGYQHEELIDREELLRLVPTIAPHCTAALIARRDGAADPHRTITAFRAAVEAEGVTIVEGCRVIAIDSAGSDWKICTEIGNYGASVVVNAAGAWAAEIAAMIGDDIPLGHKASMMIVTERIAPLLKPVVSVVGRPLSFKQSDQGTLVIGGGLQGRADIAAQKSFLDFNELAKGARAAADLFPCIGPLRIVRAWTGMEAKTDDHLPVIGASPNAAGIFHVFGFSGHGFQLVPVVGAIVSDLVIHGGTNRQTEAFSPSRLMQQKATA